METDAIAHALSALAAARDGDAAGARAHLAAAAWQARRAARRDRQVVEIASLAVAGHRARAAGLALEHTAAFPDDVALLERVADFLSP